MPTYVWSCFACGFANPPEAAVCCICNCPAKSTVAEFQKFRAQFEAEGQVVSPLATTMHEAPAFSVVGLVLSCFALLLLGLLPVAPTRLPEKWWLR